MVCIDMSKKTIFNELAQYYDLIYSWKDYPKEANKIKSLIKKHKKSAGHHLLEVACGTGNHIPYLKRFFSILATDMNKAMLSIARKKLPDVTFKQMNMIEMNLDRKFDVILCLFSSIGYVKTYQNLTKTIQNFAEHLKVGGVMIIEPWLTETVYMTGLPSMTIYDGEGIKIARLCVCQKRGILSVMDMHYLIAKKNQKMKHFVERHELAMFNVDRMLSIMNKHGLQAKFLKNGLMKDRGLYIGIKK